MLDLNTLQTFVLVADQLNFSSVAEQRNTVQSAISAQIRKLEENTGHTLISRGRGQSMELTAEGKALLVYARRILALSDEAIEAIRAPQTRPIVRLGTTVTLAMSVVTDVLTQFAAVEPETQIQILCDRSDALLGCLDRGEIDVAFMMDQGRRVGRAFVHSQPLVWACSDQFKPTEREEVVMSFLTDGRDLRRYALQALDEARRAGRIAYLSPHPIGVRAFVQAGLALTVMPQVTVTPPLITAPRALGLPSLPSIALSAYAGSSKVQPEMATLLSLLEEAAVYHGEVR
ncbi:MAG: LysR substrate-binding domain-containing protein [Pseudomonadota bacterium]